MENVGALEKFATIEEKDLSEIEGGLFPIIIGGVVITKGAVAIGGLFVAGVGVGWYLSK